MKVAAKWIGRIWLWALPFWLAVTAVAQSSAHGTQVTRVLLVGDSWADFMWQDRSLRQVFAAMGHGNIIEKGDVTAVSGTTAADWAQPDRLASITAELQTNPSIDLVQLTMGGNDFLAGMSGGGWFVGMTPAAEEALFDRVATDIETVADHILALDPEIQIVLSFYDYANFVESLSGLLGFLCTDLWQDLGEPTPLQINELQIRYLTRIAALADSRPRVFLVTHLGSMQFHFGYPSMAIPPGNLVPPGDTSLPSPPEAMRFFGQDCFHLNAEGHQVLAQNLYEAFYSEVFCLFAAQFLDGLPTWPAAIDIGDLVLDVNRLCQK